MGWKKWLAMREAISPGHRERYSDEQIEYHYTQRRSILDPFMPVASN
jgi:RecJ-like exonuclease